MVMKDSHSGHHGDGVLPKVVDPGAVGSGYIEADIAKRINTAIRKYAGVPDTTDYKGKNVNQILANTVANMNRYPGDYHISVHLNAFNGTATGIEVWYWAGDEPSRKKAVELAKALSDLTGLPNRGAKATVSFYVLHNSVGRTLLLEIGFIDNPNDMKKVVPNIDAIGKKITQVMGAYKEPAKPEPPAKPSTPTPPAKPSTNIPNGFNAEKGTFTVTVPEGIRVRVGAHGLNAKKGGVLPKGYTVSYDSWAHKDGYVWIHYIGNTGDHLYAPVRPIGKTAWGIFK